MKEAVEGTERGPLPLRALELMQVGMRVPLQVLVLPVRLGGELGNRDAEQSGSVSPGRCASSKAPWILSIWRQNLPCRGSWPCPGIITRRLIFLTWHDVILNGPCFPLVVRRLQLQAQPR